MTATDAPHLMTSSTPPTHSARRKTATNVLSSLAAVFLLAGLMTGGYLCFSIWGTAIETRQHQEELRRQLTGLVENAAPQSDAAPAQPRTRLGFGHTLPRHGSLTSRDTNSLPVAPDPPRVARGEPIGVIDISSIGLSWVVVEGIGVTELRQGPGHFPDTPLPGYPGNSAIAGHRTTYGAPFSRINDIVPGDEITLTTTNGTFTYLAVETVIVNPDDYAEVASRFPDLSTLSLVSCHPKYSTRQRIIVHAVLERDKAQFEQRLGAAVTAEAPGNGQHPGNLPQSAESTTDDDIPTTATSQPITSTEEQPRLDDVIDDTGDSSITWTRSPSAPIWARSSLVAVAVADAGVTPAIDLETFDPGFDLSGESLVALLMWSAVVCLLMVAIAVGSQIRRWRVIVVPLAVATTCVASFFMFSSVHAILPAGS